MSCKRRPLQWALAAALCLTTAFDDTAARGRNPLAGLNVTALRTGDLVFRAGRGWRAQAVRAASGFTLTHVGIVDRDEDGQIFVIHAEPPDGARAGMVRRVPLAIFADPSDADRIMAFRLDEPAALLVRMTAQARIYADRRVSFDDRFDLSTPNAVYCTELVWRALAQAGDKLVPRLTRIDAPVFGGAFMMPLDLIQISKAVPVL